MFLSKNVAGIFKYILLSLLCSSIHLFGSTYYVDYIAGSDSNIGTQNSPIQHCPGDKSIVGQPNIVLRSGDTVIFKGGVAYLGYINCTSNGVTYDGNSNGTFGVGRSIFNGQSSTSQIYGFYANNLSGIVFNNIEMEFYGGHGSIPWSGAESIGYYGYAIYLDSCSHITVQNCYFHNIGDWQNVANANEGYMEGVGIGIVDDGNEAAVI